MPTKSCNAWDILVWVTLNGLGCLGRRRKRLVKKSCVVEERVCCGGKIRPDVVWFGEMLDPQVINKAFSESEQAELFFSVGTSAIVHPAASLPVAAKRHGATLVEINLEVTPLSNLADFYVSAKSGEFLPALVEQLKKGSSPR